jgi:hypothetical protein
MHHYYIAQAIWYQPIYTLTINVFQMAWLFIFQKKKKIKHLEPTYLSNYLNIEMKLK